MGGILILFGSLLVLIALLDVTKTTLTTKGEGPITQWINDRYKIFLSHHTNAFISSYSGAGALILIGVVWLVLTVIGWTLIFEGLSYPLQPVDIADEMTLGETTYYVGFTLSTLGIGDPVPVTPAAKMLTVLASLNGMLIITLVVTYALSVVGAVIAQRALAYRIYLVGGQEGEFGNRFSDIDAYRSWLGQITGKLIPLTEQRLAYPVLDSYVGQDRRFSVRAQLGNLGLALSRECHLRELDSQQDREIIELLNVLKRYTCISGLADPDLEVRFQALKARRGALA